MVFWRKFVETVSVLYLKFEADFLVDEAAAAETTA